VVLDRLLPETEVAAPPCRRVREWSVCRVTNRGTSRLWDRTDSFFPTSCTTASRWMMNDPEACRWNKSAAQCRWIRLQRDGSKRRETTQAKPSLSTGLQARHPERFFAHSKHSTNPRGCSLVHIRGTAPIRGSVASACRKDLLTVWVGIHRQSQVIDNNLTPPRLLSSTILLTPLRVAAQLVRPPRASSVVFHPTRSR
jgi:hypothetical protein